MDSFAQFGRESLKSCFAVSKDSSSNGTHAVASCGAVSPGRVLRCEYDLILGHLVPHWLRNVTQI